MVDPSSIDPNTIMGQNLPLTPKTRHLGNWCKQVKDKMATWTSHSHWEFEVKDV